MGSIFELEEQYNQEAIGYFQSGDRLVEQSEFKAALEQYTKAPFRNFRDEKLLTNPLGKLLVNLYYQISPSIAKYVEKQPAIKNFLRHQLRRLAESMRN